LFLDYAKIFVGSGAGGDGAVSFRREKYVPRGGPDGGDGGRGGHIVFKVNNGLTTLSNFRYKSRFKAEKGQSGGGGNRSGKAGKDLTIEVPIGTIVKNAATHQIIADLTETDAEFLFLPGGRGGRGNARFATPTRQTPRIAEKGESGSEVWVELELKLLADVALIGYPNVGKSTLISRISAARPKIADYPFTTLEPNLGVVDFKGKSFVVVDIPGLIEGAHQGAGLGLRFLRHIERTRLLVHLIDLSGLSGRDPYRDYLQINKELLEYNAGLGEKIQIVALNKTDLPGANELIGNFHSKISDKTVMAISAATGAGVDDLLDKIIEKLDLIAVPALPFEPVSEEIINPDAGEIKVIKEGPYFTVLNDSLLHRVSRFDPNNEDSVKSLQRLLKRWKVEDALLKAGIKEGDSVQIGDFEFVYFNED